MHDWCNRRLRILEVVSDNFALRDLRPDCTPHHFYIYMQLRTILHAEVFDLGFELPRCHPPDGGYSWTPPISGCVSGVSTLSILGEDVIEDADF